MTTGSAAFATTHGVIYRVHNYTAVVGAATEPAAAACFTALLERVLGVAYNAYCGFACGKDFAGFSGRKFDNCVIAFA